MEENYEEDVVMKPVEEDKEYEELLEEEEK